MASPSGGAIFRLGYACDRRATLEQFPGPPLSRQLLMP
jgi:hypothetical protein